MESVPDVGLCPRVPLIHLDVKRHSVKLPRSRLLVQVLWFSMSDSTILHHSRIRLSARERFPRAPVLPRNVDLLRQNAIYAGSPAASATGSPDRDSDQSKCNACS